MSTIASTPTSTRLRRWIVVTAALASMSVATSTAMASQDFRSPDARPAATQDMRSPDGRPAAPQDLRSPDGRDGAAMLAVPDAAPTQPAVQDLRSPDARGLAPDLVGQFSRPVSPQPQASGGPSDWVYLAVGGALSLLIAGTVLLVQRRRGRVMPIGS